MSDLNGFDGIFQISEGFLVKLATVIETKFAHALENEEMEQPGIDLCERAVTAVANRIMIVPRLLFATRNPDYALDPNTSLSPIERRLKGHRNLGLLDERARPNRLVFKREEFFTLENPPQINFETNQVRISISGTAFLGRTFRTRAGNGPLEEVKSGPFSMDLVYTIQVIDAEDKGLGFQRFFSVVNNLGARAAGNPTLPQCDMKVYALRSGGLFDPTWYLPPVGTPATDLRLAGFHGEAGEQVHELLTDLPRFEVQSRDVVLPSGNTTKRLFLIDKDGPVGNHGGMQCTNLDPTVVARPRQGRISLVFDRVENLRIDIPGQDLSGSAQVIQNSLVRLNPFIDGVFDRVGGIPAELFSILEVLGDHALDIPLFPKVFPLSLDPLIAPGTTFVSSASQAISFTDAKVIADDALVLAGTLAASGGNIGAVPSLLNLPNGSRADLAMGMSTRFLHQAILMKIGQQITNSLSNIQQGKATIDSANLDSVTFEEGFIRVQASGDGTYETPWYLPNADFSFTISMPIRVRLQNTIARGQFLKEITGKDGITRQELVKLPVDAWGEQIPEKVLGNLGIAAPTFTTADPDINPVCFVGYCDPQFLPMPTLACTVESNAPVRYNEDGSQRPPGPADQRSAECHRQRDFSDNPPLQHVQEIGFREPSEDEIDLDTEVDFGFLGFLVALLVGVIAGVLTFGIGGVVAGAAVGLLVGGALTGALVGLGLGIGLGSLFGAGIVILTEIDSDILFGGRATSMAAEALAKKLTMAFNPTLDLHVGVVSYTVDVSAQGDPQPDLGALIVRNRMIVEVEDERTGLEGFLDAC